MVFQISVADTDPAIDAGSQTELNKVLIDIDIDHFSLV